MRIFFGVFVLFMLVVLGGCEEARLVETNGAPAVRIAQRCIFMPSRIKFTQLSEFSDDWNIIAYLDVLDEFGSRIKASTVWRFELYEYVKRSAEPKGSRLYVWDDIFLTDAEVNNSYWQDFMRSYKFDLPLDVELAADKIYILEAICFTADARRLTDSIELKL